MGSRRGSGPGRWVRVIEGGLVTVIACATGLASGCAEERDPINRVQLNAITKSFLIGERYDDPADDPEFYARTMVIDVPYGESGADFLMFTNTINSVSKIKWSFEGTSGDFLVGRITFERVGDTDGKGLAPSRGSTPRNPSTPLAQNDGVVVYQFRVKSHFDVRRAYNPATGEEQNVVEENTVDRPWNERDYVRVDFSENLVTAAYDFDTLSLLGIYNAIEYTSAPLFVENPDDVNAPVIRTAEGYFDVTNKVFAAPKTVDLGGGFQLPGCMLPNLIHGGTQPVGNCNPNEITLRHSFRKVVDKDYEPAHWDGQRFETYGAFTTERQGYTEDYGVTDKQWLRYLSRYNIWERSHYYEKPATMEGPLACAVDDDCLPVSYSSRCDTFRGRCTLPYSQRQPRPVVWHYSDQSPATYFEATREAAEEWDTAMRTAVVTARYAECKRFEPEGTDCGDDRVPHGNWVDEENALFLIKEINACRRGEVVGRDPSTCDALADELGSLRGYAPATVRLAKEPAMVILCHSPVAGSDPEPCGAEGTVARLGDLRFNLVTSVPTPETNSPWGIMSDGNDPLTGEKVASSINVWTHVNDLFARNIVDTLRYIGGELESSAITEGTYVDQWIDAARLLKGSGTTSVMDRDERDKRIAAAGGSSVAALRSARAAARSSATSLGASSRLRQALLGKLESVSRVTAAWNAPTTNGPLYEARATMARGTSIEAEAATAPMRQLAGTAFGDVAVDPALAIRAASIFQGLRPQARRAFEQRFETALADRGACVMPFEATAPLSYVALSEVMQGKFGKFSAKDPIDVQTARAERMKDWLRRRAHYSVIAHEMGHSFALRHNFVGSSDAWNYRPQYWQLRTNDKAASTVACAEDGSSDPASCVGPRWKDPVTANEAANLIHMWSHATTMDYAGEPSQDLLGIGSYDFGAARMFYGDVATVYDEPRFKNGSTPGRIAERHQNEFGGLLGFKYGPDFSKVFHYADLDAQVSLLQSCAPVKAADFRPVHWDESKDGAWNQVVDGHIVTNEGGRTTKCTQPRTDFVSWESLRDTRDKTHARDPRGRARVPQGFASDEWADLGNVAVFRHDAGADLYETMHFWIAQQEMNHIFTNYRRGRRDFSIYGAFNRSLSRYQEKMRDAAKAIGLYVTLARDTVSEYGAGGDDPQGFVAEVLGQVAADNTVASSVAFDYFAHVFARPEPGKHGTISAGDPVLRWQDESGFAGGFAAGGAPVLTVANGVTGGFGTIGLAGRPIENALATDKGRDYNRDYTVNVGSYYEKAFTSMLFTESADNFISASRDDFVDPRFRAVSLADVFPDGFRRWLGANLTGDDTIKGVFVRGTGTVEAPSRPDLDENGYAVLGQTSWWPTEGVEVCFPQAEKLTCRNPLVAGPTQTGNVGGIVDPQVGWEQQKFALLFALMHLPTNGRTAWVDQMRIFELGTDADPGFANRIEFHDPAGRTYVAQTFGTEVMLGKTVQKGIAARVLEYANELLRQGVVAEPILRDGVTIGWQPTLDASGDVQYLQGGAPVPSCDRSRACTRMKNYVSVPRLLREAGEVLGWTRVGGLKGVY